MGVARLLGYLLIIYFISYAVVVFAGHPSLLALIVPLVLHLVPAGVATTMLAIAWNNERIGGTIYIAVALAFMIWVGLDLLLVVPLLITGALFLLDGEWRSNLIRASMRRHSAPLGK
jgi:hypothetical protein